MRMIGSLKVYGIAALLGVIWFGWLLIPIEDTSIQSYRDCAAIGNAVGVDDDSWRIECSIYRDDGRITEMTIRGASYLGVRHMAAKCEELIQAAYRVARNNQLSVRVTLVEPDWDSTSVSCQSA